MKITAVEVMTSPDVRSGAPLLVLRTDAGLSGIGEIFVQGRAQSARRMAAAAAPLLIGRDPFDREALTSDAGSHLGSATIEYALAAAAGTAMADIAGQDLGVPVHMLLGGRVRDRVRACAVGWEGAARGLGELTAAAALTEEAGFSALRVDLAGAGDRVALVRHLRRALPDGVDLVVNAAGRLAGDPAALVASLAEAEPLWVEDPLPMSRLAAVRRFADGITMPLAGGRGASPSVIRSLIRGGLVDHVVLEVGRLGGLLEARRIAALAEVYHVGVVPTASGAVSLAAALHLAASIPNLTMVEVPPNLIEVEEGTVAVGLTPGLGAGAGLTARMEVA